MKRLLLATLVMVALAACRHKESTAEVPVIDTLTTMVTQIQKCSRLYTTEYQVHKIITHDDQMTINGSFMKKDFSVNLPMGKRKIAIPIDATVKGYVDFSQFGKANVKRKGNKIEIVLPDPGIAVTSSKVDHKGIKQYVALTRSNFSDEELSTLEQKGREAIENDIPKLGIVASARESAANILVPIALQMGYKAEDVTITFRKDFAPNEIKALIDKSTIEHVNNGK